MIDLDCQNRLKYKYPCISGATRTLIDLLQGLDCYKNPNILPYFSERSRQKTQI